ncbi:hypothetical protein HCH_03800 [Hahella chejuensis KCTC 2396]|uniref:Uncharacterized protein n=1 Tax=Hahella chejuensis (strain KCTC 2396) TaxID=349521 RepID=Q2SFP2_HAHCH|nr:hypothetical protein HCH_03800 [Hahella chejuensis KCTC 2396]
MNYDYGHRLLNDMPASLQVSDIHIEQPVLKGAREKLIPALLSVRSSCFK